MSNLCVFICVYRGMCVGVGKCVYLCGYSFVCVRVYIYISVYFCVGTCVCTCVCTDAGFVVSWRMRLVFM